MLALEGGPEAVRRSHAYVRVWLRLYYPALDDAVLAFYVIDQCPAKAPEACVYGEDHRAALVGGWVVVNNVPLNSTYLDLPDQASPV